MVTLAEIARRVGYSKQRVHQLAHTPEWPIPKDKWQRMGRYWLMPWEPVEAWFNAREPVHGVHLHRESRKEAGNE